jgi:hypothetical protein
LPKQRNNPLDEIHFELVSRQPDHRPACEHGFEILLGVLRVAAAPVVPATAGDEDSAFDFDERSASHVCEVGAPPTGSMEPHFPLQRRTLRHPPEQQKP